MRHVISYYFKIRLTTEDIKVDFTENTKDGLGSGDEGGAEPFGFAEFEQNVFCCFFCEPFFREVQCVSAGLRNFETVFSLTV